MSEWEKKDYVFDTTRISPHTLYAGNAVLVFLWVIGFVGLAGQMFPASKITEFLYQFYTIGNPTIFVILWTIMILEIFFRFNTITSKLNDVYGLALELRVYTHMMWKTLALGFGLIFGTLSLFANTISDPWSFALVIGASFVFSNICGIIADGYTRESPVCEFITKKTKLFVSKIRSR